MIFTIDFWFPDNASKRSGFDYGYIRVSGSFGSIDSSMLENPETVTVYLTIIEILDSLRKLIGTPSTKKIQVVGAGSSFKIDCELEADILTVRVKNKVVEKSHFQFIARQVLESVRNFLSSDSNQISHSDPVFEDLSSSIQDFESVIGSVRG